MGARCKRDISQAPGLTCWLKVDIHDCLVPLQAIFQDASDLGVIWGLYLRFKLLGQPQELQGVRLRVPRDKNLCVNMVLEESKAQGNIHICMEHVQGEHEEPQSVRGLKRRKSK